MRIPLTVAFAILTCLSAKSPLTAQTGDCDHRRDLSIDLEAGNSDLVRVQANAGSLRIVGRSGSPQIVVRGTACASSADRLSGMRIDTERTPGNASIATVIPEDDRFFRTGSSYARIDLVVEVPANASLDVRDGSGSMEIEGVGGAIEVDDGSGEILIRDAGGDVRLADGSGSITVEGVGGSLTVQEDGSGSIDVSDVRGNVLVREDGSGGIDVDRVGGDFTVRRSGSGGVDYARVAGSVDVPRR